MSEWIKELFVTIFGVQSWLATLIISMIPIVELRGAIPFGSATAFWGENALSLGESLLFSLLGSTLVCVVLTFLFWPIFKWLKQTKVFKNVALWVERKLNRNAEGIEKKTQSEKDLNKIKWLKIIAIFGFVAIPLPLTGVWTGTCLALFIGLNKKQTMSSVILGNIVAGLLMTLISYFFKDNTMIVFYAFFVLLGIFIIYELIKSIVKKCKNKKQLQSEKLGQLEESKTIEEEMNIIEEESKIIDEEPKVIVDESKAIGEEMKTIEDESK